VKLASRRKVARGWRRSGNPRST